ncbi:hypothetical protein BJ170DRAFT_687379 [Xylariales sp. AK1849]|nr:hypothetical protein BJ170DRAFT_687379 [Xylariales sp. AK1849]
MAEADGHMMDTFLQPESTSDQAVLSRTGRVCSDVWDSNLIADHSFTRTSRRTSSTPDLVDQVQSPGSFAWESSIVHPIPESTSATSVANTLIRADSSSSESMFLRSSTAATAVSTPTSSVTAESPKTSRSRSTSVRSSGLSNKAQRVAISASRNIMRHDYLQYLKTEVSSWIFRKEWLVDSSAHPEQAPTETSAYSDLEVAYSTVCQLDTRICIDTIRSRVALIRLHREYVRTCESWSESRPSKSPTDIGRGKTSFIIDHILRRIHQDWQLLDKSAQDTLRAKFHSQKRFGKRWLLIVEVLGPGILLICSHKLANMIRNSAVTIEMLKEIAHRVGRSRSKATQVLQVLEPFANAIVSNHTVDSGEVGKMIRALESIDEDSLDQD